MELVTSMKTTGKGLQNPVGESRGMHGPCQSGHLNRDSITVGILTVGAEEGTGS